MTVQSRAGRQAALVRVLATLSATQILGWGTTYYLPALLARPMSLATGVSLELVFGGVTLMSLASAVLAPAIGRRLQRSGAGPWMALGSVLTAAGLAILAFAGSPTSFVCAWLVMGVAAPLSLNQAASTAIVQASPAGGARRGLTILLLFTGLASTAMWPLLIWLDGAVGWRGSILIYAGLHLFACAPLHALMLPRGPVTLDEVDPPGPAPAPADAVRVEAKPPAIPGGFWLAALSFSASGFISYGLPLHIISVLEDYGHTRGTAVLLGTLLGPGQLLARGLDIFGGHRIDILNVGFGAALLMPVAILVMWLDGGANWAAVAFTLGYAISAGLMSIVRAVAPIRLFGRAEYAAVLGRLSVPLNIAFALSPIVLALVRGQAGSEGLLALVMGVSLASLAAITILRRRAFRSDRVAPV